MSTYECVEFVGYNPDSMFIVYRPGRSARWGLGSRLARSAKTMGRRKGIQLTRISGGLLKEDEIKLLQCFYGKYSRDNREFLASPRLLCPRTGKVQDFRRGRPVGEQLRVFAKECRGI
jgi:hypothetical protein